MRILFLSIFMLALPLPTVAGTWRSASHFGYAVTDHSNQGFNNAAGSLIAFDGGYRIGACSFGLKTIGSGNAIKALKSYRLATGPFISYRLFETFEVGTSLALFNESGLGADNTRLFKAKGYALAFDWGRSYRISDKVGLGLGGFWGRAWGKTETTALFADTRPSTYLGNQRGVQLSLQISL